MADKIDQLNIGGTAYDIDLPPDAIPIIASVNASGSVTAATYQAKTASLQGVKFFTGDGSIQTPQRLVAGTNIYFSIDDSAKKIYINKTDSDTWRYVNSSQSGVILFYKYSGDKSSKTAPRYAIMQLNGTQRFQVACGINTSLSRTATVTISFPQPFTHISSFFATFGNASSYQNYVTQIKNTSLTGFTYTMQMPSGATASSACFCHWVAISTVD